MLAVQGAKNEAGTGGASSSPKARDFIQNASFFCRKGITLTVLKKMMFQISIFV